jgi:hypothetical protein
MTEFDAEEVLWESFSLYNIKSNVAEPEVMQRTRFMAVLRQFRILAEKRKVGVQRSLPPKAQLKFSTYLSEVDVNMIYEQELGCHKERKFLFSCFKNALVSMALKLYKGKSNDKRKLVAMLLAERVIPFAPKRKRRCVQRQLKSVTALQEAFRPCLTQFFQFYATVPQDFERQLSRHDSRADISHLTQSMPLEGLVNFATAFNICTSVESMASQAKNLSRPDVVWTFFDAVGLRKVDRVGGLTVEEFFQVLLRLSLLVHAKQKSAEGAIDGAVTEGRNKRRGGVQCGQCVHSELDTSASAVLVPDQLLGLLLLLKAQMGKQKGLIENLNRYRQKDTEGGDTSLFLRGIKSFEQLMKALQAGAGGTAVELALEEDRRKARGSARMGEAVRNYEGGRLAELGMGEAVRNYEGDRLAELGMGVDGAVKRAISSAKLRRAAQLQAAEAESRARGEARVAELLEAQEREAASVEAERRRRKRQQAEREVEAARRQQRTWERLAVDYEETLREVCDKEQGGQRALNQRLGVALMEVEAEEQARRHMASSRTRWGRMRGGWRRCMLGQRGACSRR